MKGWLFGIIIILVILLIGLSCQISHLNTRWEESEANVKAYSTELSKEKSKSTAYKFTVEQLEYFQDSVLEELDKTRKELKIKDKNLKSLQYLASSFHRSDTIRIKDTLFREPTLSVDTFIGDSWYQLHVGLKYPSEIAIQPTFRSEKHVVVSLRKETVNPPKKFFLLRWLQKKHKVLQVDVTEKNPYVKDEYSKYIEIIK